MSSHSSNRTNRNVYKPIWLKFFMVKKEVSISLDEAVLGAIDSYCKDNGGAKRSTVINNFLKDHPKIKRRLKKK